MIIIPAYNEEKTIESTLNQCVGFDVIVAFGGTDNTGKIAKRMGAKVIRVKNSTYAKAILEGMRQGLKSRDDRFIVMDCESHTLDEIKPYINKADIVAGDRRDDKKPLVRKILSRMARLVFQYKIKDPTNGFRCYSREIVDDMVSSKWLYNCPSYSFNAYVAKLYTFEDTYNFPMTYRGGASQLNYKEFVKAILWLLLA
jgi:glycosyltransferase involved in cell wall biosynthesis